MVLQPCFNRYWRILKNHSSNVFSVLSWTAMLWFCIHDVLKQSMCTAGDYCVWEDWHGLIERVDYFVHTSNCCASYSRVRIFQGCRLIEEIRYLEVHCVGCSSLFQQLFSGPTYSLFFWTELFSLVSSWTVESIIQSFDKWGRAIFAIAHCDCTWLGVP